MLDLKSITPFNKINLMPNMRCPLFYVKDVLLISTSGLINFDKQVNFG